MNASTSIFTLTATRTGGREPRCWGWYPTLPEAESAVARNVGGMDDCLYTWLVIEEVPVGVGCNAVARSWYRYNDERQGWALVGTPSWAEGMANWGMG